ncbi:alpha/beta fold hydrolase [Streptomyces sp. RPT161]|uniref:alpha/beta fold hydrolase n=1 Tax=Streptomyces sp. RPT161 TaxID=3015993 RepID=UPI0022B875A2|nr:alpha/beta fold hydrolase [Streptomyces sp. RPT161]
MELRLIDTGDVRLACRVSGDPDGPPVVLLHALGETSTDWDAVAEEFAARWRVYVPDLRGHGRSDWPGRYSFDLMRDDVLALLNALRLDRVTLLGHSMGGVVAHLFAQAHPERVERLVLEEVPAPYPRDHKEAERPDGELDFDWEVVAALHAELAAPPEQWRTGLAGITAPTLVIAGGSRSHIPQDQLAQMARLIPGGRLLTIPSGHLVHAERPEDFTAAVLGFLPGGRR